MALLLKRKDDTLPDSFPHLALLWQDGKEEMPQVRVCRNRRGRFSRLLDHRKHSPRSLRDLRHTPGCCAIIQSCPILQVVSARPEILRCSSNGVLQHRSFLGSTASDATRLVGLTAFTLGRKSRWKEFTLPTPKPLSFLITLSTSRWFPYRQRRF